jgi:hypothetical protein
MCSGLMQLAPLCSERSQRSGRLFGAKTLVALSPQLEQASSCAAQASAALAAVAAVVPGPAARRWIAAPL